MSTIHIADPTGSQAEYDEEQIESMWQQGLLEDGTHYWREGMSEWRPIAENFSADFGSPEFPPPLTTPGYFYTKDPRSLTSLLVAMLWISLCFEVVAILSDFAEMSLFGRPFTMEEAEANDSRQAVVGLGYLAVTIVTAVAFLKWIYRAYENCRGFGADDMSYSPGWSIGYFFIPILNLVRPYQAMKEIWQASGNPRNWQSEPGSPLLGWWWALWLIAGVVGQMAFRFALRADTIDQMQAATVMSICASIVGLPLCIVAMNLVKTISWRQELLVNEG